MAYTPITGQPIPYPKNAGGASASGYYLKGYEAGTNTPLSMATDNTGGTTLDKCLLNTLGYPLSSPADDTTVFIPHFDESYKLILYPTAADADGNITANAEWIVDNIKGTFDAAQISISIDSLQRTSIESYLENKEVKSYTNLRGIASAQLSDGESIHVTNDGIAGVFTVKTGTVTDNGGTLIVFTDDSNRYVERVADGAVYIGWFGGIAGSSTANAATNATALEAAVDYCHDNNGGCVDLGVGEWVFAATNITSKKYFTIWGNQAKIKTTGAITFTDCGFFFVHGFGDMTPTIAGAHDGFVLASSADRNARFCFSDMNIGLFDNGIHCTGDISQGFFQRIQLGANTKSIYFESGFTADHVVFDELIFGNHAVGSTAFDCRMNNWALTNSHFETNIYLADPLDTTTYAVLANGQQFRMQGNTFTASGGIILDGNNGVCSGNILNNTTTIVGIDSRGGENAIDNNDIRWATNTSAAAFDGTNKTAIKLTTATSCSENTIKRTDIGIRCDTSNLDLSGNKVNDAVTSGIELGNVTNVTVTGGSIFVGKTGAAGITQASGNGDGIFIDPNISLVVTGSAVKYSGLGSNVNGFKSSTLTAGDNDDFDAELYSKTLRITANASGSALTGIADGHPGREMLVVNISANTLTLENEDTASTAVNRITSGTGAAITLDQNDTATLIYDDISSRWRILSVLT